MLGLSSTAFKFPALFTVYPSELLAQASGKFNES